MDCYGTERKETEDKGKSSSKKERNKEKETIGRLDEINSRKYISVNIDLSHEYIWDVPYGPEG